MATPAVMLVLLVAPLLLLGAAARLSRRFETPVALGGCLGITMVFLFAGMGHVLQTEAMSRMLPPWVPGRVAIIYATGVLEIAAACAILVPRMRRLVGWCLLLMLIGMLPSNVYAAINRVEMGGHAWGPVYLLIRVPLQLVIMAWVWWFAARPVPIVMPLARIRDRHAAAVGPKAAGVARLARLGMPVPPGFCILRSAYREHLQRNGLAERVRRLHAHGGDRGAALAALREAIVAAPVAVDLAAAIAEHTGRLDGGLLAVRSSATKEDLPDRSFAGQYDTVLGVAGPEACALAVKRCWASLWTDRAHSYRSDHGIDHAAVEMAVLVQRLVRADASGVLFTADPVGAADRIVIEGGFGLGEAVVSGRITPDRVVLRRGDLSVAERAIGSKPVAVRALPGGGVTEERLPPAAAAAPCLDDAAARRLAELALKAESDAGFPLDLEWAIDGGTIYLLQARPITTRTTADWEDRQVWTNANSGEVIPDVVTPMTESAILPLVVRIFGTTGDWLGVNLWDVTLFGTIAGRIYFNLNTFAALLRRIPGLRSRNLADLLGGRQDVAAALGEIRIEPEDMPDLRINWLKTVAALPRIAASFALYSPARGNRYAARFRTATDELWNTTWQGDEDEQIVARILAILDDIVQPTGFLFLSVAAFYYVTIFNLCRRWLNDEGNATASRLLAGLGSLDSAEAGLELWRLAALAAGHPEVEIAVRGASTFDELRRRLAAPAGGRAFLERWDAFMRRHGHHTRGELELANARWSEDPQYVLGLVRSALLGLGAIDPIARARQLADEREALAASCQARLRNPLRRVIFRFVLPRAQLGAPIRENLKSEAVRRAALVRLMLLELGRRLAKRGVFDQPEDVFYLRQEELARALRGAGEDLPRAIAARRAERERNRRITPPGVIVGRFDPEHFNPDPVDESAVVLSGIAASPGTATGPARVIERAGGDTVRPGEILVAPFTDPGWTPYFLNAAAIVMDLGGLLSHGCIVAREYGIPCVVNVGSATKIIKTGAEIRVDGDRGTVTIMR